LAWTLPTTDDELLALAKGYPFAAPANSYLYRDGGEVALDPARSDVFEGRRPVVAHGSNRSPAQLRRKFDYLSGSDSEIPVTRAWLADHDVVYSAHVTQYGSIAANLQYAPGVRAGIFVTWLSELQLTRMHDTELGGENYAYGVLEEIHLELEMGPITLLEHAYVYLSVRGCLEQDGAPLGLAAVPAEGRHYAALHQEEAITLVRDRHHPDRPLEAHILSTIRDIPGRKALVVDLERGAIPAAAPHFRRLAV
jgi:hypothetical protein